MVPVLIQLVHFKFSNPDSRHWHICWLQSGVSVRRHSSVRETSQHVLQGVNPSLLDFCTSALLSLYKVFPVHFLVTLLTQSDWQLLVLTLWFADRSRVSGLKGLTLKLWHVPSQQGITGCSSWATRSPGGREGGWWWCFGCCSLLPPTFTPSPPDAPWWQRPLPSAAAGLLALTWAVGSPRGRSVPGNSCRAQGLDA